MGCLLIIIGLFVAVIGSAVSVEFGISRFIPVMVGTLIIMAGFGKWKKRDAPEQEPIAIWKPTRIPVMEEKPDNTTAISGEIYCTNCGNELAQESNLCDNCGHSIIVGE
jgi:hypothetical protein